MPVEILAVGGYNEIGKNMTAIKIDDIVIVCDMGIHLDNYIKYTQDEREDLAGLSPDELTKVKAIPDISVLGDWKDKVKVIVPTHAHLDHIGAVPFLASQFDCPILGTPFTIAVIQAILRDEKIKIPNELKQMNANSFYKVTDDIKIEFVNMTHSTPHTITIAIHTKYGIIMYSNDFKFDESPTLGQKPNFRRLQELGEKGVLALICESTYAYDNRKMPSESVAKQLLKDVMLNSISPDKALIVTTFSSHIARLKSIIEYGKKLNRKIVFLGRSLSKYVEAAESVGIVKFSKDVELVKYGSMIKRRLKKIPPQQKNKYLLVITGHQGEPKATLSKMADQNLNFKFDPGDQVIFSCHVIPTENNQRNREILEGKLKDRGVRIFGGIHVSGHAAREDLREMISMVRPKNLFPAHGIPMMTSALKDLAKEEGYKEENVLILDNGQKTTL